MEPFKRLNWARREEITSEKLNDMVGNDDWLFQNMITGYYNVYGVVRESGLTMRAGYVKAQATEQNSFSVIQYFPKPFLPGTRPVVVCSLLSNAGTKITIAVKGLDDRAVPDHRGFVTIWNQFRDPGSATLFSGDMWASYIALAPNG
jgi:hypothetical protein